MATMTFSHNYFRHVYQGRAKCNDTRKSSGPIISEASNVLSRILDLPFDSGNLKNGYEVTYGTQFYVLCCPKQ